MDASTGALHREYESHFPAAAVATIYVARDSASYETLTAWTESIHHFSRVLYQTANPSRVCSRWSTAIVTMLSRCWVSLTPLCFLSNLDPFLFGLCCLLVRSRDLEVI